MFIPESAMGGLPSAAAASSMGVVEQVARHYAVGKQLSRERVAKLAVAGEARVAQLIRWVNEDDRGAPAGESITAEAVLRAQRGNFEVYEMLDARQQLLVMRAVLRLQGTSCTEVLSMLSAKEPSEVDATLEDLLGPQLYSASTCLYHTEVDMAKVKRDAARAANTRANVPPPQSASATAPVKTTMAVQWMAAKDVAVGRQPPGPLREFFFMRFNQSFATTSNAPAGNGNSGKSKRQRVSYGVSVWESIELPTCVPLFPTSQMRRRRFKHCGFVVEASETPGSDTTRVSFFITAPHDPKHVERDSEWLLRMAEGALNIPSALVNRRIRRNQLRDRRHWAYANACAVCNVKFGMLTKKHHCRICGGTVCTKCSEMRSDLRTSVLTASARVCKGCLKGDSLTPWNSSSQDSSVDLSSERGSLSSVSSWSEFSARGNGRTFSDSTRGSIASSTYSDSDNRDRSWSMESFGCAAHVAEPTNYPSSKTISTSSSSTSSNSTTNTSPQPAKAVRSVSQEVPSKPKAVPHTSLHRSISTQDAAAPATQNSGSGAHRRTPSRDNYPIPAYQAQQMRAAALERKVSGSSTSSSSNTTGGTRSNRVISSAAALASFNVPLQTNSRAARGVSSAAAMQSPASGTSSRAPLVEFAGAQKSSRSHSHDGSSNTTPKDSNLAGAGSDRSVGFTVYQVPGAIKRDKSARGRSPTSISGSGSSSEGGSSGGFTVFKTPKPHMSPRAQAPAVKIAPPQPSRQQPNQQRPATASSPANKLISTRSQSPRVASGTTSRARGVSSSTSSTSSSPSPPTTFPITKVDARNGTSKPRSATRPQPEAEPATSNPRYKYGYPLSYAKGNPWPDAPIPTTEAARLERIKTLNLSQHFTNTELRELLQFACSSIQCSVGVVSVVAVSTSLLVTTIGLRGDQLPRDMAPDAHVLMSHEPTIVLDTQLDDRFAKNPLVASNNMRFFLGVPLVVKDSGVIVGALSLIDTSPRTSVKPEDIAALTVVASRIVNKMDSRNIKSTSEKQETAQRAGVLLF